MRNNTFGNQFPQSKTDPSQFQPPEQNLSTILNDHSQRLKKLEIAIELSNQKNELLTQNNELLTQKNELLTQKVDYLTKIAHLTRSDMRAEISEKQKIISQDDWLTVYQVNLEQRLCIYFDAYRALSSHLITADLSRKVDTIQKIVEGVSTVLELATEDIPIAKYATKIVNRAIKAGYKYVNKKESVRETDAVCAYLIRNKDPYGHLQEDVELNCLAASVKFTLHDPQKLRYFIQSVNSQNCSPFIKRVRDYVLKVDKHLIETYTEIDEQNACQLAFEDAMLVMAGIYEQWETLIRKDKPMEEQLFNLVIQHYPN